jgi:hypothetical protein
MPRIKAPLATPKRRGFRGSHALATRTEAVAALGAFYIEWTHIESCLAIILATLLFGESLATGDEGVVMEIVENSDSIRAKVASVIAVARERLHDEPDILREFSAKMVSIQESARLRNKLVHGRWFPGPEPGKLKHQKRLIGEDDSPTTYTPYAIRKLLNDLELKFDDLFDYFLEKVVPVSEDLLRARRSYFATLDNGENGLQAIIGAES